MKKNIEIDDSDLNLDDLPKAEIERLQMVANLRFTNAKAACEEIKAKKEQLEFDRQCEQTIYLNTAIEEFNGKLGPIMAMFKTLPTSLVAALKLTPKQHKAILDECQKIYGELEKLEFKFDTALEVDDRMKAKRAKKSPRKV